LANGNDDIKDEELSAVRTNRQINGAADSQQSDPDPPAPEPQSMPQTRNGLSDGEDADTRTRDGLSEKLDALAEERDMLRREVTELRQSLEDITSQHELEVKGLREDVESANEEKEQAKQKHATLLERVNGLSATLGERLKSNAVCPWSASQSMLTPTGRDIPSQHSDRGAAGPKLCSGGRK
jgi:DNA repair exonuclease SbcCD ATPase subunit